MDKKKILRYYMKQLTHNVWRYLSHDVISGSSHDADMVFKTLAK